MKKIAIFSICLFLVGCAGRLPAPKTSQRVLKHHFHHYGKQFKETAFGKSKVREVEILDTEEIHKNLVTVTAFVTLEDGDVFKVRVTLERGSFGWRYVSWENLG